MTTNQECSSHGIPFLKVYVADVSDSLSLDGIYPEQRYNEIESTKALETKKHKLSAWRLLQTSLSDIGFDIRDVHPYKDVSGKWMCTDGPFFSISHSKNLVCVAISSSNVGVDIQCKEKDYGDDFAERILTSTELGEYYKLNTDERVDYIYRAWCQKESIMKTLNTKSFFPSRIETGKFQLYFTSLNHGEDTYYLSVCSSLFYKIQIIITK